MLVQPVGIIAVSAISRTARRLSIGDAVRLWSQYAQKGFGRHGSCANLHVIRLLQHTSTLRPEGLETQNEFLKCESAGVCHELSNLSEEALSTQQSAHGTPGSYAI